MKTFLTEKNNIPEGATHFANETDTGCFIWYREDTNEIMVNGYVVNEWESVGKDEDLSDLEPIPQTKEVEWVNGDKCSYEADNDSHTFIAMTSDSKCCIRYDVVNKFFEVCIDEISKPETEAERIERVREKNGEAMYIQHCKNLGSDKFYWNEKNPASKEAWCKLAEQYRKESE